MIDPENCGEEMERLRQELRHLSREAGESMNLNDIHRVCQNYAKLGSAVQDQLRKVLEDPSEETFCDCNVNALAMIHEWLEETALLQGWSGEYDDDETSNEVSELADEILGYVEDEPGHTIRYGRIVNR